MFTRIKKKIDDMKTISKLCQGAEKHANLNGEEKPGVEHFMLSALDLPDGTARGVFKRLDTDPDGVNQAIKMQHFDALKSVGMDLKSTSYDMSAPEIVQRSTKLYDTQPSGQILLKELYKLNKNRNTQLLGVHVLEVVASMEKGIAARTLRKMGIDPTAFNKAIKDEKKETSINSEHL